MYNIMIYFNVPLVNASVVSSGPALVFVFSCSSCFKVDFPSQSKQMQSAGPETLFPHSKTVIVCGLVTCPECFSLFLSVCSQKGFKSFLC